MAAHPLDVIARSDDKLFKAIGDMRTLSLDNEGVIAKKNKILIALAIDTALHSENGIKSLAQQALAAGATKNEIMETLRIAYYICGVGCIYTAAAALKDVL